MAYQDMTPGPPAQPPPPPDVSGDTAPRSTGFDVEGAKKAGYSDAEIANHLAAEAGFDAAAARKAGYSDQDLISHLSASAPPAAGMEGTEEGFQAGYAQRFPQPAPRPAAPPAPPPGGPLATGGFGDPGTLSGAVAEGWRDAPSFWTSPQARQGAANVPVAGPIYAAGGDLVGGILGVGNALFRGIQHTAAATAEPVGNAGQINVPDFTVPGTDMRFSGSIGGPGLGRDVAAFPEAFPTGFEEVPRNRMMPPDEPPRPQFVSERTAPPRPPGMTDAERIQQLVEHSINAEKPPPEEPPQPTAGETAPPGSTGGPATPAAPQPAGAQITPATELGLTPREEAAYRSTAEGQKLLEPPEPGVRDDKTYLTGERVNEAEASQDVEVARKLKSDREQTPPLDKATTADENHNNNIRTNAINNTIPGQVQITAAKTAREDAMKAAEPKVFENATDADVRPIVQHLQEVLNDPKNLENTQLQQYVRPLIDRLQNPDGTPKITNARQLWGWRQDVQHLTSGAAQATDRNLTRVSGVLGGVLEATDDAIEGAAPGYKAQLRDDYRNRSREIDAMEALNAERFKLFDSQNKPNYNAVQGLMRRIVDARQSNDPYDAYTHVSQETLDKLWNIRDSMRRTNAVDRLGGTRGSPTSQNLGDALRNAARTAVEKGAPALGVGLGAALFPSMPVVGSTLGLLGGTAVNHLLSERGMQQRFARGLGMLNVNQLMQQPPP